MKESAKRSRASEVKAASQMIAKRRATHSAESLGKYATQLRHFSAELAGLAESIPQDLKAKEIPVYGATMCDRGIDLVAGFIANVKHSIEKQKFRESKE